MLGRASVFGQDWLDGKKKEITSKYILQNGLELDDFED
jgi:hypothetical protein